VKHSCWKSSHDTTRRHVNQYKKILSLIQTCLDNNLYETQSYMFSGTGASDQLFSFLTQTILRNWDSKQKLYMMRTNSRYPIYFCTWFLLIHFTSSVRVTGMRMLFYRQGNDRPKLIRGCIQKFPEWVDNEINNNNKHSFRSNTKGYSGKTHYTDSQNSDATALSGREMYHLQFSLEVTNPETLDSP
jgi:hypothetical protein